MAYCRTNDQNEIEKSERKKEKMKKKTGQIASQQMEKGEYQILIRWNSNFYVQSFDVIKALV